MKIAGSHKLLIGLLLVLATLAADTLISQRAIVDLVWTTHGVEVSPFNLALLVSILCLAYRELRKRRQAEDVLAFTATHDPLTSLPNRVLLGDRLNHALAARKVRGKRVAILFIDLDRFKNINDTLGHDAGDRLLKNVALRLSACVRKTDTVARQGGDEFVVLIEEFTEPSDITPVAEKILAAVAKPLLVAGEEFQITASIGVATSPDDGSDMQTLLMKADIAMLRAKEQGKNNYQFYSDRMNVHSFERLQMESDLRCALERNQFLLHYQPKVTLRTGQIIGMEALIRWCRTGQGLVPPQEWIPLAE